MARGREVWDLGCGQLILGIVFRFMTYSSVNSVRSIIVLRNPVSTFLLHFVFWGTTDKCPLSRPIPPWPPP